MGCLRRRRDALFLFLSLFLLTHSSGTAAHNRRRRDILMQRSLPEQHNVPSLLTTTTDGRRRLKGKRSNAFQRSGGKRSSSSSSSSSSRSSSSTASARATTIANAGNTRGQRRRGRRRRRNRRRNRTPSTTTPTVQTMTTSVPFTLSITTDSSSSSSNTNNNRRRRRLEKEDRSNSTWTTSKDDDDHDDLSLLLFAWQDDDDDDDSRRLLFPSSRSLQSAAPPSPLDVSELRAVIRDFYAAFLTTTQSSVVGFRSLALVATRGRIEPGATATTIGYTIAFLAQITTTTTTTTMNNSPLTVAGATGIMRAANYTLLVNQLQSILPLENPFSTAVSIEFMSDSVDDDDDDNNDNNGSTPTSSPIMGETLMPVVVGEPTAAPATPTPAPAALGTSPPTGLPTTMPIVLTTPTWIPLGGNAMILGENAGDELGDAVAISGDGSTLVVGAQSNGANGPASGQVRVFRLLDDDAANDNAAWEPIGEPLNGNIGDQLGVSVAVSENGNVVAVGADGADGDTGYVRAYRFNADSESWDTVGDDITGSQAGERLGFGLAMDDTGSRLVVSAPLATVEDFGLIIPQAGRVQVFDFDEDSQSWEQVGGNIQGLNEDDTFGFKVDISGDGATVAVGAPPAGDSGTGLVETFQLVGAGWDIFGNTIEGAEPAEEFGFSLGLSQDGTVLVASGPRNGSNGENAGQVGVYQLQQDASGEASWQQAGNSLVGPSSGALFGSNVAISGDGTRIAIGSPGVATVTAYDIIDGTLVQAGQTINGESDQDESDVVSLSSDGGILAIGAPANDQAGADAGQAKAYTLFEP